MQQILAKLCDYGVIRAVDEARERAAACAAELIGSFKKEAEDDREEEDGLDDVDAKEDIQQSTDA